MSQKVRAIHRNINWKMALATPNERQKTQNIRARPAKLCIVRRRIDSWCIEKRSRLSNLWKVSMTSNRRNGTSNRRTIDHEHPSSFIVLSHVQHRQRVG